MEDTLIMAIPISRSYIRRSTGVASAHFVASNGLISVVITVHSSSSQSAQVFVVSSTFAAALSVSPDLPFSLAGRLHPFHCYHSTATLFQKIYRAQWI